MLFNIEFRAMLKEINEDSLHQSTADDLADNIKQEKEQQQQQENEEEDEDIIDDTLQPFTSGEDILIIKSSISRFFCGEGRSQSPFGKYKLWM